MYISRQKNFAFWALFYMDISTVNVDLLNIWRMHAEACCEYPCNLVTTTLHST